MFSLSKVCRPLFLAGLFLAPLPGFAVDFKIEPFLSGNVAPNVPVGKSLVVPVSVTNQDGSPYTGSALTFKATSSNANLPVRVKTGNPILRLHVKHEGSPIFEGDLDIQLYRDLAPIATGYIAGFAQAGYFDNLTFHRVIPGFVAQGGDPAGNGTGGPGFTFENEFQPSLIFSGRGQMAMANSGYSRGLTNANTSQVPPGQIGLGDFSATNGSQFFLTQAQQHNVDDPSTLPVEHGLDFKHTIFGQLVRGWPLLASINTVPIDNANSGVPTNIVRIQTAKILPGRAEATLLIGSKAAGTSAITVTATDESGAAATGTLTATTINDTYNNRAIMGRMPTTFLDVLEPPNLVVTAVDLEKDPTSFGVAGVIQSNNSVGILPNFIGRSTITGGFGGFADPGIYTVAFGVTGFLDSTANRAPQVGSEFAPYESYSWEAQRYIVGKRPVTTEEVSIDATANTSGTFVVGRFSDTDPASTPATYSAKIIWGDGTTTSGSGLTDGVIGRDSSRPGAALFTVSGTHTYARSGIYTPTVILVWNVPNGTPDEMLRIRSTAYVSPAGAVLRAQGETLEVKTSNGAVANRILATFNDTNKAKGPADYKATVDWGDGLLTPATVLKVGPGRFAVRGSHTFKDAETFPLNVRIHPSAATDETGDTVTWSKVTLTGFKPAPHAPPFPIANVRASWDDLSSQRYADLTIRYQVTGGFVDPYVPGNVTARLGGRLQIRNWGDRTAPGSTIRAYLSPDPILNTTGANPDVRLKINGFEQITAGALAPGASANTGTTPWIINLPKGTSGGHQYFITEAVYSDPIINGNNVPKYTVIALPAQIVRVGLSPNQFTTQDGTTSKVTFKIVLDSKPTATVTIPIASSLTTQGTVSPTSLVFNSSNYDQPQLVTVTGVQDNNNDTKSYNVTVGPAVSTDSFFSGLSLSPLPLTNKP